MAFGGKCPAHSLTSEWRLSMRTGREYKQDGWRLSEAPPWQALELAACELVRSLLSVHPAADGTHSKWLVLTPKLQPLIGFLVGKLRNLE